jgi:hypothetical protein
MLLVMGETQPLRFIMFVLDQIDLNVCFAGPSIGVIY